LHLLPASSSSSLICVHAYSQLFLQFRLLPSPILLR
jgi:hypothetical protein